MNNNNNNEYIYEAYVNKKGKYIGSHSNTRYVIIEYDDKNKCYLLSIYNNKIDYASNKAPKKCVSLNNISIIHNIQKSELIIGSSKERLIFDYDEEFYKQLMELSKAANRNKSTNNNKKDNNNIKNNIKMEENDEKINILNVNNNNNNNNNHQNNNSLLNSDQIHNQINDNNEISTTKSSSKMVRNWNEEFQTILQSINDNTILDEEDKFLKLSTLARDFVQTSTELGRTIIAEVALPASEKTIKPLQLGIAGGMKFYTNGVFFKFAVDDKQLLGSNEYAAKVANHELNSLVKLYQCEEKLLCFPLMCLIDYRGYRLVAMSSLPIDDKTLVYGSNDGGKTIRADDELFNKTMKRVAEKLNLAGHTVIDKNGNSAYIYGPFDMEGHLGQDNRYYCLDFARLFPCEPPNYGPKTKNPALYRLLRPELVRMHNKPLSCDAFISLGGLDREGAQEIINLHQYLLDVAIPKCADYLNSKHLRSDVHRNLPAHIHHFGVNIRYLGLLRKLVRPKWQSALLVEAVARVLKQHMRKRFRALTRILQAEPDLTETKEEVSAKFLDEALIFLNIVFGSDSTQWNDIKEELTQRRFVGILLPHEKKMDLRKLLLITKLINEDDDLKQTQSKQYLSSPKNQYFNSDDDDNNNNNNNNNNDDDDEKNNNNHKYKKKHNRKSRSPNRKRNGRSPNRKRNGRSPRRSPQRSPQQKGGKQYKRKNQFTKSPDKYKAEMLDYDRKMSLMAQVLLRFCDMLGFQLHENILNDIKNGDVRFFNVTQPFDRSSLIGMREKVKRMSIVSYAEGTALLIQGVRISRMPIDKRPMKLDEIGMLARAKFDEALMHSLDDPATLANYSFLNEVLFNDSQLALSLQKRSTEANPYHIRSWYYLAQTYNRLKQKDEAERCFLKAIEVSNYTHPNSLKDYANLLRFRGETSLAEEYYRKALAIDPGHTRSMTNLITVLTTNLHRKLKDYEEIFVFLKRIAMTPVRGLAGESRYQFHKQYTKWLYARCEILICAYLDSITPKSPVGLKQGQISYASALKQTTSDDVKDDDDNNNNNNNNENKNNNNEEVNEFLPIKKTTAFPPPLLATPQKTIKRLDNYVPSTNPHNHNNDVENWPILLKEIDACYRIGLYFLSNYSSYWLNYADFLCYFANDFECAEFAYRKALECATSTYWKGPRRSRTDEVLCNIALGTFLLFIVKRYEDGINCLNMACRKELTDNQPRGDVFLHVAALYWKHLQQHENAMREYERAIEHHHIPILVSKEYIEYLECLNAQLKGMNLPTREILEDVPNVDNNITNDEKENLIKIIDVKLVDAKKQLQLIRRKVHKKVKNVVDLKFTPRLSCQDFKWGNKNRGKDEPKFCRSSEGLSTFYCACRDKSIKPIFDHPQPFTKFLHNDEDLKFILQYPIGQRDINDDVNAEAENKDDVLKQAEEHVMMRSRSRDMRGSVSSASSSTYSLMADTYNAYSGDVNTAPVDSVLDQYDNVGSNFRVPSIPEAYDVYQDLKVQRAMSSEVVYDTYGPVINKQDEKPLSHNESYHSIHIDEPQNNNTNNSYSSLNLNNDNNNDDDQKNNSYSIVNLNDDNDDDQKNNSYSIVNLNDDNDDDEKDDNSTNAYASLNENR